MAYSNLTKLKNLIKKKDKLSTGIYLDYFNVEIDDDVKKYIEDKGWHVKEGYLMFGWKI